MTGEVTRVYVVFLDLALRALTDLNLLGFTYYLAVLTFDLSYFPRSVNRLKCAEAPDEPPSTTIERVLKLECNITVNTNFMHGGILNVSPRLRPAPLSSVLTSGIFAGP